MNRIRSVCIVALLVAAAASGCQPGQRAVQYSDEAIQAVKGLLRTNSDEAAIRILDDAARATSAAPAVTSRAAIAWSRHITPIRDRILSGLSATADDEARVRAFVVGSTCDAFTEAASWPNGIVPQWRLNEIVRTNQATSRMPPVLGMAQLIADLTADISAALADGEVGKSVPGLAQSLACAVAAG